MMEKEETKYEMPDMNRRFLEMDGGELPGDGEVGSDEVTASGNEVAGEDLSLGYGETDPQVINPDIHGAHQTLQ